MNKVKKTFLLITICFFALMCFYSLKKKNKKPINVDVILSKAQLPNGLFIDLYDEQHSNDPDLYSTCMMKKIKTIVSIEDNNKLNIDSCAKNIDEILAINNSNVTLSTKAKKEYKQYLENLTEYKLLQDNKNNNYILNMLDTLYAIEFANNHGIEISYTENFKKKVIAEIKNINDDIDIIEIFTLYKAAYYFDIEVSLDFLNNKINNYLEYYENICFENISDVIRLYYISELINLYELDFTISDTTADILTGLMCNNYYNVTIFYDVVKILSNFDKLTYKRVQAIKECIGFINERFLQDDNNYSMIVTYTPSYIANYSALYIVDIYNVNIPKQENIKNYYKKISMDYEYIMSLNIEDLYYCYLACEMLNINCDRIILQVVIRHIENLEDLTLVDLFYIVQLSYKLEGINIEQKELLVNYLNYIDRNYRDNYEELTGFELSMLVLIYEHTDIDMKRHINRLYGMLYESNNLIEITYIYTSLSKIDEDFEKNINKKELLNKINKFRYNDGYSTSLESQVNTMHSTYFGTIMYNHLITDERK